MNKKFSTLAVAAMLASAFTAYAGPGEVVTKLAEGNNGKQYQLRALVNGSDMGYLTLDEKDGALKLLTDPNAYTVNGETVSVLGKSLWCVDVTLENQGKNPIFDFINKGEGSVLDVTVGGWNTSEWTPEIAGTATYKQAPEEARVGGEISGWEFTPVLGSNSVPMFGVSGDADTEKNNATVYSLNSYISSTHIATLVWDADANSGVGAIKVAVVAADEVDQLSSVQVKFFLQEAYPVDLTAEQFNTILNTQKETETVKMTFVKDYNNTEIVNPFSTNEFNAADALTNQNCDVTGCNLYGKHNFVYLYKTEADATKNYLRVDTAYANGYGTKFLTFAFASKFGASNSTNPADEEIIPDQYKFRLNYCPTDDSLSIQVMSALYKLKDDGKPWRTLVPSSEVKGNYSGGYESTEVGAGYGALDADYNITEWTDGATAHPSGLTNHITNWVKLQDLELSTESRIVTIGDAPINTHISFGYGDCASVASEYTSVADGVYYIKNAKGQYLTYPIYVDNGGEPQFVTVNADEQDVAHMPAFQWVVLKKYVDAGAPTSPIKMANREFNKDFTTFDNIQLKKAAGATYMYAQGNTLAGVTVDSLEFVAVPQESIEDPYLGYKKLTKEELQVNKYTFNYWHPYAQDKYIALAEGDSTFTVWDEISAFNIDTIAYNPNEYTGTIRRGVVANTTGTDEIVDQPTVDIPYGFKISKDVKWSNGTLRIKGLAQLVRTAYQVSLNGTEWKVNTNDQFNIGKNSWAYDDANENEGVQSVDKYVVFFKENMHVDGQHYYAILKANNEKASVGIDKDGNIVKVDNGVYNRSFDRYTANADGVYVNTEYVVDRYKAGVSDYDGSATLKNQPIVETRTSSFAINPDNTPLYRRFNSTLEGIAGDGVDTLRFYEKYRNEYLMIEANPSFMVEHIDFLGINAQDKAQGGLAFIVDTAWVNRGAGNIKPQYLISIDRHDYQGVAGEPCTESGPHIDESGHITDDPYECVHAHKAVPGFKRGKFLINFHDFANNDDMVGNDDYKWAEYDRAGFKEAIIVGDTMYILRDEFKNLKNEEIDLDALASAEVEALKAWTQQGNGHTAANFQTYKYVLTGDNHKYVTWSMRFFDRSVAANEVEADRAFLFESMKSLDKSANANHYVENGSSNVHDGIYKWGDAEGDVAPTQAAWLKMQNGCLVLSDENSKFNEVTTGSDDALIFNVEHVCGDEIAVDNEEITVEGVSVVAGNGQVTIMGAAGKNVTITNILGKVIASQIIASDNATIAVPAGIVAVAVEGEAAVKAIVK